MPMKVPKFFKSSAIDGHLNYSLDKNIAATVRPLGNPDTDTDLARVAGR